MFSAILQQVKQVTEIHVPLLPLKMAIFLYFGANSLHAPYLVLQGFKIGIRPEEMTMIFAVIPIVSFAGPPIAGYLSDKLNQGKLIMLCSICFCAILNTSMLFIDAKCVNRENNSTDSLIMTVHCHQGVEQTLSYASNQTFPFQLGLGYTTNVRTPINTCNGCKNGTMAINEIYAQLIVQVRDTNWISVSQSDSSGVSFCKYCKKECLEKVFLQIVQQHINREKYWQPETNNDLHRPGLWLFIAVLLGAKFCMTATFTLMDTCCIRLTEVHHGPVGGQKIYGVISAIVFSFVAGALVTWMTELRNTGQREYDLAFYGSDFLLLCLAVTVFQTNVIGTNEEKVDLGKSPQKIDFKSLLTPDVITFLIVSIYNGVCHFYIDTYFSVFMIELGASDFLLSLCSAVANLSAIPLLLMGDRTVDRLGYAPVMSLVLLTFSIRMAGYSFISNPWLCLPLEVLKALTSQFFIVASCRFCSETSPIGHLATLNGIQHACNFSIGGGMGNFWGGFLASRMGRASGFRLMALVSVLVGVSYYALHYCFLKKEKIENEIGKIDPFVFPNKPLQLPEVYVVAKTSHVFLKTR